MLAQSYSNWEYVLVNNCSSDRSLEIAQSYAARDPRIRLCDNKVLLEQRRNFNHALRQISPESKYCKIVLGDDWIFQECLSLMVKVAEANPSVGIVGAYRLDDRFVSCDGLPYPSTVVNGRDACRSPLLGGPFLFGSATSLLIRSHIIRSREPFYNESSLHEDTEVCYEILKDWDFGFVHQVLTFTRRENESTRSLIKNFNPDILDGFIILKKYGHLYLDQEEYEIALRKMTEWYYRFLGESVLRGREEKFWNYHRKGLETIGCGVDRVKLSKYILLELMDAVLNPKRTIERFINLYIKRHA